jgi:hypothetical protein
MSCRSSLALVLTLGCLGVAIEGATTTYRSQDRHGKVVTVQVGDPFTFTVPAPPRQ